MCLMSLSGAQKHIHQDWMSRYFCPQDGISLSLNEYKSGFHSNRKKMLSFIGLHTFCTVKQLAVAEVCIKRPMLGLLLCACLIYVRTHNFFILIITIITTLITMIIIIPTIMRLALRTA